MECNRQWGEVDGVECNRQWGEVDRGGVQQAVG